MRTLANSFLEPPVSDSAENSTRLRFVYDCFNDISFRDLLAVGEAALAGDWIKPPTTLLGSALAADFTASMEAKKHKKL